ncbi:Rieske (2Fe-2S) protein [Phaeacidiphilus oryzae]|uniref:Rieske (2Fe-2S) protein n=1 Tax=Phaeacidiphilus oryzae TaxID=348818 RepID=UPI00055DCEC6|nr:Rieske (2Fe-2S) protein [Phaeacidiphilus oryzae]
MTQPQPSLSQPSAARSADELPAEQPACPCGPGRRSVLRGAAAVGVLGAAGAALAACSGGGGGSSAGSVPTSPETVGAADEIPVGGGRIFAGQKVVVTQPSKGEYKAFSAVCTHQGCTVNEVSGGVISCPCHGSQFKVADGSVANGPATKPLPPVKVAVAGGKVVVG